MNIKLELIQSYITEMVKKLLEDNIIDYSKIADTNAITILDKIKNRMEEILNVPVDVVVLPIPEDSLIEINKVVPLYAA